MTGCRLILSSICSIGSVRSLVQLLREREREKQERESERERERDRSHPKFTQSIKDLLRDCSLRTEVQRQHEARTNGRTHE